MSRWTIYDKNGNERAVQWSADVSENVGEYANPQLEYRGTWMGECFVTLTVKCAVPVDFHIGDYIVYRGEKFVINYDPSVVKKARRGTYGEGFTYENVKFNALHNELTEVMFIDYVLGDNGLHYTSLPVFPFFAASIDDFCDRLQANTNRYCENNGIAADDRWLFLTPTLDRTVQRALSCGMSETEAVRRWNEAYGSGTSIDEIKTDVSVSISNQTIWNAMTMIKNSFGLNFVNRSRSVIIGSAGLPTNHIFEYGKGNGLYEIERVADSEQQIVTKLYAYGNETNLPVRYYANAGTTCWAVPSEITHNGTTYHVLDIAYNSGCFTNEGNTESVRFWVCTIKNERGDTATARVYHPSVFSLGDVLPDIDTKTIIVVADDGTFMPTGARLTFLSGIDKDKWPSDMRTHPENLPNNMAVNRLMLPGFPSMSLYEWVKANGGTDYNDATGLATWHGYTAYFSKDKYQPYILSLNSDELGIREYAKTFDGSDGDEDIFPTIEGTGFDTIQSAEQVDDNGIFAEGDDEPTVTLTLPSFGADFDLKEQAGLGDSPAIVMKDGYCGGRSFSFEAANVVKNTNGTFTVKCKREHDSLLDLWFPYSYNKSKGQPSSADEPYQVCAGDKYVLTGIPMTSTYVEANAVKLLEASLLWLSKNDYTRHTYLPKVDEIYMARQHDTYLRGETARSLYLTIKEGDLLRFMDEDLHIGDSMIFIDSLTIKEYGNAQIPTYDITLRNDKEVGTIERMQEQINSLSVGSSSRSGGGSGGSGGGMTANQINSLIEGTGEKLFLSKKKDDTAEGRITFLKGLEAVGGVLVRGVLSAWEAVTNRVRSENYTDDTGFELTNDNGAGASQLTVDYIRARRKLIAESVEVKEYHASAGDEIFTGATAEISRVDYFDSEGQQLGVHQRKVPFTLNGVLLMLRKVMGTARLEPRGIAADSRSVRGALSAAERQQIARVRCYFLASDGERDVENWWAVGDLAYCMTQNLTRTPRDSRVGSSEKAGNVFWWRQVIAVDADSAVTLDDGKEYHYIDFAVNYAEEQAGTYNNSAYLSDLPAPGDKCMQFGNVSNSDRMNAIMVEVNGVGNVNAPDIVFYRGIYTYSLDRCWWGGESCRKAKLSPSTGWEFTGPDFKFITEYGQARVPVDRGAWSLIPKERDVREPHGQVIKCYYFDRVTHLGSLWLCVKADDYIWLKNEGTAESPVWNYWGTTDPRTQPDYSDDLYQRVLDYTTVEPSENAPTVWQKQVAKGETPVPVSAYQWNQSPTVAPSPLPATGATLPSEGWTATAPARPGNGYYLWMTMCSRYGDGSYTPWGDAVCITGGQGSAGEDAKEREWIYIGKSEPTTFSGDTLPANIKKDADGTTRTDDYIATTDDFVPQGWQDTAIAIDETANRYVYASWRVWDKQTQRWGSFQPPILWGNWGVKGEDGDGVQYVFRLFDHELTDTERETTYKPTRQGLEPTQEGEWIPAGWSDDPLSTTSQLKWCYCSTIKRIGGEWGDFEKLALWSKWSEDGTSPWVADLDNEMDSVACDADGHPTSEQTVMTGVSLFFGSTAKGFTLGVKRNGTAYAESGAAVGHVTASWNNSTGVVSIIYATEATISDKDTFEITVTATDDSSVVRVLNFTVNGMRPGPDGKPATIYNLLPSQKQISVGRNADGTYNPTTFSLRCGYVKNVGGEMTTVNDVESTFDGWNVFFRFRGRGASWSVYRCYHAGTNKSEYLTNVAVANVDAVEFVICNGSQGATYGDLDGLTVIDRETVPVVADGANGTNGRSSSMVTIFKRSANNPDVAQGGADRPTATLYWNYTNVLYADADCTTAATTQLNGWSLNIPAGTDPCWARQVAVSGTGTATISISDWSSAVRCYKDGDAGADGYSFLATPASMIVNQDLEAPYGFGLPKSFTFSVMKGETACRFKLAVTMQPQDFTLAIDSPTAATSHALTLTAISGTITSGLIRVTLTVTDPDGGGTFTKDMNVMVYVNRLGTWRQTIENGMETIVAEKISYVLNDKDDGKTIDESKDTFNSVRNATVSLLTWQRDYQPVYDGYGSSISNLNTWQQSADTTISTLSNKVDGHTESISEIRQTAKEISLSVTSGYRNYIKNPLGVQGTVNQASASSNITTDATFVPCKRIQYTPSVTSDYSLLFDVSSEYTRLTRGYVTYFVICKRVSTNSRDQFLFGPYKNSGALYHDGIKVTVSGGKLTLDSHESDSQYNNGERNYGMEEIGNGWYRCWFSFMATEAVWDGSSQCGINNVYGTWDFYAVGIVSGKGCPSVASIVANTGIRRTGIDIEDGKITAQADTFEIWNSSGTTRTFYVDENGNLVSSGNASFSGKVTATDGEIGGFYIGADKLYNTNYGAGIAITNSATNPSKAVLIGDEAEDTMTGYKCGMSATCKDGSTYNTALFLDAQGGSYNYAFHGNGNGVLNGLVFGFKTQYIAVGGSTRAYFDIGLKNGSTIIFTGYRSAEYALVRLPTLYEVRNCLGLVGDTSTPFFIELNIINKARGASADYLHLVFRGYSTQTASVNYPYLMSDDDTYYDGGAAIIQLGQGDIVKLMLMWVPSGVDSYGYRAYPLIQRG